MVYEIKVNGKTRGVDETSESYQEVKTYWENKFPGKDLEIVECH